MRCFLLAREIQKKDDKEAAGTIYLEEGAVIRLEAASELVRLSAPTVFGFSVKATNSVRKFYLCSSSHESMLLWMTAIKNVVNAVHAPSAELEEGTRACRPPISTFGFRSSSRFRCKNGISSCTPFNFQLFPFDFPFCFPPQHCVASARILITHRTRLSHAATRSVRIASSAFVFFTFATQL